MKPINPEKTARCLVTFLKTVFAKQGFKNAAMALSGGVDSSTSCALVVAALGSASTYPILLPYGLLNEKAMLKAQKVITRLGIPQANVTSIDISPFVDPIIKLEPAMEPIRRGNIMARVRMTLLFDQAKKRRALVVGTENKSEHLLGYFTRFGDEASDIEPLRHLYKTQVYRLARYLELPQSILTQAPSAGLWAWQTDEGEYGFTYKDADEILSLWHDEKKSVEDIVSTGWKRSLVDKVIGRAQKNSFKHHLPLLP